MVHFTFSFHNSECLNHEQPKSPTISAFGRASTLSLGSIAFGSLIVTLLDVLRLVLEAVRNLATEQGNRMCLYHPIKLATNVLCLAIEACLACCAACFIGCIQNLVEYFNR